MKKLGLCLSGGGARGAYQVGAMKALKELGLLDQVQAFSGASIGAANSAIFATASIEKAEEIWTNIPENPIGEDVNLLKKLKEEKLKAFDKGFFSMEHLEDILVDGIDFDLLKDKEVYISVSESGLEKDTLLKLVHSSFIHYVKGDTKSRYIELHKSKKEEAVKAIEASCSIPVVFSPVVLDDIKYYDGGVFDNAPISPLIESGCDEIIVINISFINQSKSKMKSSQKVKVHQIKSKRNLGGVLDFNKTHSLKLFEYGYEDTMNYFSKYRWAGN